MHRLNWLKNNPSSPGGVLTVLAYYNELARKFLLDGKFASAHTLLTTEFNKNLSQAYQEQLRKAERIINNQLSPTYDESKDFEALLAIYIREKDRIIKLAEIETQKHQIREIVQLQASRENLMNSCWDMICSQFHSAAMLLDAEDARKF